MAIKKYDMADLESMPLSKMLALLDGDEEVITVKISRNSTPMAVLKKVASKLSADNANKLIRSCDQSVNLKAKNGQMAKADLAIHQIGILAKRFGVELVYEG